jgi:hypothetical protein
MRARIATAAAILLVALSGFAASSNDPKVNVHLTPLGNYGDMFYFRGPINLQYQLTVDNPTGTPLTLRRLELRTVGPGAYSLRTGASTPIKQTIQPGGTTNLTLSVWGRASGGYLRSEEPVTVQGIAYFVTPTGHSFVRSFVENFRP